MKDLILHAFLLLTFTINFFVSSNNSYAQENKVIDSLKTLIKTDKADTNLLNHLNDLALEYSFANTDSAINISNKAIKQASKILKETQDIKIRLSAQMILGKSCYQIASFYDDNGNYELSIFFNKKALLIYDILINTSDQKKVIQARKSKTLSNIGNIYNKQGDYPNAIDYYLNSLKIAEEIENKRLISTNLGNIGIIYKYQGNYEKALEYYFKALKIAEEINNKIKISSILGNIGIIYDIKQENEKALEYYIKALKIAEEIGDKSCIETNYINIGELYKEQKDFPKALKYYLNALKIAEEINDRSNLSVLQGNIGTLYTLTKKYADAEVYLNKALIGADSINYLLAIKEFNIELSNLYEAWGKTDNALKYYKKAMVAKDSLFNADKNQEITRKEMNFDFDKKQAAIKAEQDKKDAVANAYKNRQQLILILVCCVLLLVILFAFYIFRSLRITKKQKAIIEQQKFIVDEKNCELNSQNEEISAQRDEIEAQRDVLSEQNNLLYEQKQEITDSITYAKRIQNALLPTGKFANELLGEHFILFKPKDIVSGDFYWATRIDKWLIVTVADCTGHGVPGAFMSMLGISFLNEIVRKKEITQASQVLDQLRGSIIDALKQKGVSGEQKDGMDMCLCVINTETYEMQYAGANNPLYIVKSQKSKGERLESDFQLSDFELYELKGDRMPVSIYIKMAPFKNNIVQLNKGDCLYLSSDGFKDQFGGIDYKKYKSNQFKDLLLKIHQKPMSEQSEILHQTFINWKGNHKQIDDVTVLGIRI
ncbi:MAG: tetratricopeptide repeat protein [Bacteroidia bacterium]|nr:tetratricopeptide repeat protein [Bacteroidia bacterium]